MMIQVLGAALIAAGGAFLGFQAAENLQRRVRSLRRMGAGLAVLERELELTAPPLPRLLERGAACGEGPARALFEGCLHGLDNLDREGFPALWRRLVQERAELPSEGQAVLAPLGDILGRCEAERQREALSAVRRQLAEMSASMEMDSRRKGKVYQALGLSGGAFLIILLL